MEAIEPLPETEPVPCAACGRDVAGAPARRGRRTCPGCGRIVRNDGSLAPPLARPEVRCPDCGYDVAGIPNLHPSARCPECDCLVDLLGYHLEAKPEDGAAAQAMLHFLPYSIVFYLAACGLCIAVFQGISAGAAVVLMAIAVLLAAGEAVVQAKGLAKRCWPLQERREAFIRLAVMGVGLTLAAWLPVALVVGLIILL